MSACSGQFPALINLFIALERIVAIQCASFYRRVWKNSHKWYLVILAAFLTSVFMIAGVIINLIHVRKNPTRLCSTMQTTGAAYGTIHYTLIAILYLSCFIALNIIFYRINKTRVPPKAELRKQKMSLAIVGASVVLASIPLLVVTLNEWETPKIDGVIVGVAYCSYAMHSGISLIIYIKFQPDFRHSFLSFLHIKARRFETEVTRIKSLSRYATTPN
ncbi:hypothetical protein ANCCAN_22376 [Ancylostoma caninum]|uniref:G-protein coupled receptors family 1 profile domain-containing protein n=1 Tax=Ancylostoma caninum TaxID=29170 RepID=A0A368FI65_ANCCA|nr:hypothetical protein ANCCAN_22376 [Ancylostoma caninum]